jgi:hypothetical protein
VSLDSLWNPSSAAVFTQTTTPINMSNLSSPGCAIRLDGSLKDASEIEWHFDKDDEIPMSFDPPTTASSPPVIHPLFTGRAPAAFVAGSRRSARTSRPSARVTDPDNAMTGSGPSNRVPSTSVGEKRKAPDSKPVRSVVRRVVADSDSEVQTDVDNDASHPTEPDPEDEDLAHRQGEFESLQAMADADHKVCLILMTFEYFC